MPGRLHFNFSHRFDGTVWSTLALPERDLIFLEVRHPERKEVTFSALQYLSNTFLWRDVRLEEPWWISLSAVSKEILLFTIYSDTSNPDKKGILGYRVEGPALVWWNNDFSITSVSGDKVLGVATRLGAKQVVLDLHTGQELPEQAFSNAGQDPSVVKPLQYVEGTPYFETVKTFLAQRLNLLPVAAFEYLEHDALIFISYYVQEEGLANYLLVLSAEGEVLLKEKIGDQLKGIGLGTFFVLAGCVFFVKNKVELVSYRIV